MNKLKIKFKFLIILQIFGLINENILNVLSEEENDTITIQEVQSTTPLTPNEAKQFHFHWTSALNEGSVCLTSKGTLGYCSSFRNCYPHFKLPNNFTMIWEAWLFGNYDTCTYFNSYGRQSFGVCCTMLTTTTISSQQNQIEIDNDSQKLNGQSKDSKYQNWPLPIPPNYLASWPHNYETTTKRNPISIMQWPPPIPTHPPDHHYPTHATQLPTIGTTKTTTKKPHPSATTIAWPPPIPTHPPFSTTSTTNRPTLSPIDTSTSSGTDNFQASCGAKNGILDQERIVGGQNASPNEWPWVVVLFNSGRQFCGGSLIDNVHILTAAHCVAHMTSWDVARLTVHLGDHNIRSNTEVHHVVRKIKRVVRHKGFNFSTLYNDVALLTLDQPVQFSQTIRPVCLPTMNAKVYTGQIGTVTGWGSLRENGPQPAVLQKVSIPIWSNQECAIKYGSAAPAGIINSMICAGKAAKDSCSGDSGGPLMVNEGSRWVQVGIVSWGIGCGKGQYPGVYTRVSSFMPWIMKNLNSK